MSLYIPYTYPIMGLSHESLGKIIQTLPVESIDGSPDGTFVFCPGDDGHPVLGG